MFWFCFAKFLRYFFGSFGSHLLYGLLNGLRRLLSGLLQCGNGLAFGHGELFASNVDGGRHHAWMKYDGVLVEHL